MKQISKRKKPEEIVAILAKKYGVSARYVQMIISGERRNDKIFTDYLWYKYENNELLKEVKRLVPFNK